MIGKEGKGKGKRSVPMVQLLTRDEISYTVRVRLPASLRSLILTLARDTVGHHPPSHPPIFGPTHPLCL